MRVEGVSNAPDDETGEVFQRQAQAWGEPLLPYKVYARRPTIMKSVVGMWDGLAQSGLLDASLTSIINRRVASLNGCVF